MKILIFLWFFSVIAFPQELLLMGTAVDSSTGNPLESANVILLHLPDSTVDGTASNANGKFSFDNIEPGNYNLIISYIGFKKYSEILHIRNKSVDLGKIFLIPGELSIEDIEIIGRLLPVVRIGDTTQYNADAFKTHKDADAVELVTKMPGITMTDGKIKAQGEEVKKVLVDGKQFFGEDPTATLRNFPAELVNKIQVFDEQSEQAKFTGFDDGNTSKTMNVVTRTRAVNGVFGRFSAGYGDDNRYTLSAGTNYFKGERRISVIGQLNNINEQNFSRQDLMGMSSVRRGEGSFMMGGVGGRRELSDFLVGATDGLSEIKAFGLNYNNRLWESLSFAGSYFINRTDNNAESAIQQEFFLPELSNQRYFENSSSSSNNTNHRFNVRIDYKIDTMNDLSFHPRFSLQQNNRYSGITGQTMSELDLLNSIKNMSGSDLSAINSSAELSYRHKFPTEKRTISMFLNGSYNNNGGESKQYSENTYYLNSAFSDTLNQVSELFRNSKSISSNVSYTEPVGKNGMVQLSSEFSFKRDNNDQKKFNSLSGGTILDTSLSNLSDKIYNTQKYGTGYRYKGQEFSFNINLNYNVSILKNDQTYPYSVNVKKTFRTLLPSAAMRYSLSKNSSFDFFYNTNNNDPRIEQLQEVLDNTNPLQLKTGNPDLNQDYRHSFSLRYHQFSATNLQEFFVTLNASLTDDYIGSNTIMSGKDSLIFNDILLNPGTQLIIPVNLKGFFTFGSLFYYSIPVDLIKSYLNFNFDMNFNRMPGMINNNTGYSNSGIYTFGLSVSSNISTDFDFTLSANSSYNKVNSNLRNSYTNEYFTQSAALKIKAQFWKGIVLDNNMSFKYDSGLPESYNRNIFLWNLSIGKKLFSKDQGEIRISAYDILNKNKNIQRYTGDSYIQDIRSSTIGRYFLMSFIYQLRSFGNIKD